jgi:hypothetical protein
MIVTVVIVPIAAAPIAGAPIAAVPATEALATPLVHSATAEAGARLTRHSTEMPAAAASATTAAAPSATTGPTNGRGHQRRSATADYAK